MKKALEKLRGLTPDAMLLGGVVCIAHGAALVYRPAGWMVAGAFAFWFGFMLSRRSGGT